MLSSIFQNLFLGFAITAFPGAVVFETMRRMLLVPSTVFKFLLGNLAGMILVVGVALFGVSAVEPSGALAATFYALSGFLLVYIGARSLLTKKSNLHVSIAPKPEPAYTAFVTGFVLAAANPLSIAFWVSLSGKFFSESPAISYVLVQSMCVVLGAALFFGVLLVLMKATNLQIKDTHMLVLARLFGAVLVAYGCIAVARAAEQLYV